MLPFHKRTIIILVCFFFLQPPSLLVNWLNSCLTDKPQLYDNLLVSVLSVCPTYYIVTLRSEEQWCKCCPAKVLWLRLRFSEGHVLKLLDLYLFLMRSWWQTTKVLFQFSHLLMLFVPIRKFWRIDSWDTKVNKGINSILIVVAKLDQPTYTFLNYFSTLLYYNLTYIIILLNLQIFKYRL